MTIKLSIYNYEIEVPRYDRIYRRFNMNYSLVQSPYPQFPSTFYRISMLSPLATSKYELLRAVEFTVQP